MNKKMDNTLAEMQIIQSGQDIHDYVARYKGCFYRGYNADLIKINRVEKAIELSRDGIMRNLPESLFFNEQYLRDSSDEEVLKERESELEVQREQLSVFFEAFDTILERGLLELHKCVDSIECGKEEFVLKELYDIDIHRFHNPYVCKLARLLLDGDRLKGNIHLIPFFVKSILDENISCRRVSRVVDELKSIYYIELQFVIYIEGLSTEEYRQRMDEYDEFFWYLEQWFMPFDCEVDYCIKDINQTFVLGQQMTLDYNVRFQ